LARFVSSISRFLGLATALAAAGLEGEVLVFDNTRHVAEPVLRCGLRGFSG